MERFRIDSRVAGELNRTLVFDLLRSRQVVSRVGLARETGLSKATISQIIDEFIADGFVETIGPGESEKGRRPVMLRFAARSRAAVGVELGDTSCRATLTDLNGDPHRFVSAPVRARSADDAIATAVSLVDELSGELDPGRLVGIGVGTPGLVDSHQGAIKMAPDLGWRDVPVGPVLADRFRVPVAVVNRAKAAAVGEAWSGAGEDADNLIYVSVSTGISAGIVIDQRLYRGVSMSEGELGHVTVDPDGPLCACGNRGCLQTVAAGPAILARVRERLRLGPGASDGALGRAPIDLLSLEDVAAATENAIVQSVLDEAAECLGIALANLVNTLNPGMVILGGSVMRALPVLVGRIERIVRQRAMSVSAASVDVVASSLGRDAVPIGAAAFLLSQISVVGSADVRRDGKGLRPQVLLAT
jgi:N-acetylglucosamine repressor